MTCCAGFVQCRPQPGKHVLDHAEYTTPTRQHELDHTDHTAGNYLSLHLFVLEDLDHHSGNRWSYLSEMCTVARRREAFATTAELRHPTVGHERSKSSAVKKARSSTKSRVRKSPSVPTHPFAPQEKPGRTTERIGRPSPSRFGF